MKGYEMKVQKTARCILEGALVRATVLLALYSAAFIFGWSVGNLFLWGG
jgi:hypothetical protein